MPSPNDIVKLLKMWDVVSDNVIDSFDLRALKSLDFKPHGGMTVEFFGEPPKDERNSAAALSFLSALNGHDTDLTF